MHGMRMTSLFSQTAPPGGAQSDAASVDLLVRAGYIRQLAAGIWSYLPLGLRSLRKLEAIMREEMDTIGGQEISMPVVQPADIWQESGRWYRIGSEMGRLEDKNGRPMVLAMTHEEVVAVLARQEIRSYRQLPQLVYQLQTKWRDDPRPRAGLIRAREFIMKDSYSLDTSPEALARQYDNHYHAYFRIFARAGLPVLAVGSDTGMMGGSLAHEYMYLTPIGEDTILTCAACGYAANQQIARLRKRAAEPEEPRAPEIVPTPGADTIEKLAEFLGVPASRTGKAVLMTGTFEDAGSAAAGAAGSVATDAPGAAMGPSARTHERLVFALLRGDMTLSETKLANATGALALRPATEAEIRATGAVPGYASAAGLEGAILVVDDLVPASPNLVVGANLGGHHTLNFNFGRDLAGADVIVADIAEARAGSECPECGSALTASRGVEVGNIFQLGTGYAEALGATYLDADGSHKPVWMGSYGIGVGRLLACIAEEHRDADGLKWPVSVAPCHVHLVSLASGDGEEVRRAAEEIYATLTAAGLEVLYDDRDARPGVKFKDADLIGVPLRITVGARNLVNGQVELKLRGTGEVRLTEQHALVAAATAAMQELQEDLLTELGPAATAA